jgi:hypothetical protein
MMATLRKQKRRQRTEGMPANLKETIGSNSPGIGNFNLRDTTVVLKA